MTTMADPKPVYIFVGGVSHTPAFFEGVIDQMRTHGYESTAVAFPTCGDNTETAKQWDEVTAIQNIVSNVLDDQKRDVVLVLHSYSGWPGSRAINGLDKEARREDGKLTGIVEVVFLAAFLLPDNAIVAQYSCLPPWLTVEVSMRASESRFLTLTAPRMDAAFRMRSPFPCSSATWKNLRKSIGFRSSNGTVMTLLLRPCLEHLGICRSLKRILSQRTIKLLRLPFSYKCYRVLWITLGQSRPSRLAMSPSSVSQPSSHR